MELASFDLAIAVGVLHHLNDAEALQLFQMAQAALKPAGRLITLDNCYRDGQSRIARFLISKDRGQYVRASDAYRNLALSVFPEVKASIREDLLRIPYTQVILECRYWSPAKN
jgi:SAM-dependent methyltransferase